MGPDELRAAAEKRLADFDRRGIDRPDLKRSAVTVTLVTTGAGESATFADGLAFLLTRRAATLRRHKKQWALPGGRADSGETITETARRELAEELGLHLGEDAVLGLLDDYATRSGYVITPVVLWGGEVGELTPNPDEVSLLLRIPFAQIDVEPRFITIPESDSPVIQVPLFDRLVHAPTGAVIYQAREVLLHGRPTRVDHLEQPVFAWR
ncbi:CoA pyrophosphatase [Pseudonocardia ailaonensis]|uniref:NUDIX hydrolase n=1 Tax=Pseudonocardia ailaonensis TaxID=367279 RepID=UPI0031D5A3E0